jgi:hypothetical protein
MDSHRIIKYIYKMRQKILKLSLNEILYKYHNIGTFSNGKNLNDNFFDINLLSIIDPIFNKIKTKLFDVELKLQMLKISDDLDNRSYHYVLVNIDKIIQNGGKKSTNINTVRKSSEHYINEINILQQKIMTLAQQNQFLMNQLQQCNINQKISDIEKNNLTDKLLFFDKSLEVVAQSISNNISNGAERLNILNNHIKNNTKQSESKTINISIDATAKLDETHKTTSVHVEKNI